MPLILRSTVSLCTIRKKKHCQLNWPNDFLGLPRLPPSSSAGKESASNVGDLGSIPGLGRSPGEGKGYPLQYSGPDNSMGSQRIRYNWVTFTNYPKVVISTSLGLLLYLLCCEVISLIWSNIVWNIMMVNKVFSESPDGSFGRSIACRKCISASRVGICSSKDKTLALPW